MSKKHGQSFRDLLAWQKSHILCVDIYSVMRGNKDLSYRDQIQRASVSIMNNIAEGHSRRSNKAFKNFLLIAKGSAAEVESMLELGKSLGYIRQSDYNKLVDKVDELSRVISGLIKSLATRNS